MPKTTNNSRDWPGAWPPSELLAHVVAAPHHPHVREALRQVLADRGEAADAIEKELDTLTRQSIRLLAALLAASTDDGT